MMRFIGLFSIAGLFIPAFFLTLWWGLIKAKLAPHLWLALKIETIQILFWPSSFFLMATENQGAGAALQTEVISIIINVLLYALIGLLVWYGLKKQRWILYVTAGVVAIGWYKLLTL